MPLFDPSIRSISAGTTRATSSEVVFANSNGVSFGVSGNTITASINAGTGAFGGISAGTQIATSGTVIFSNSNNVSFGMSNNSVVTAFASFLDPTAFGVSDIGNTSGNTGTTQGTVVFVGAGNVSLSQITAPGGQATIVINATLPVTSNAGVYFGAGTQTATSGTVFLANSNGVSFGMSGSSQVTATFDAIKSIFAGTTQVTNGQVIFNNANGVSFGANGQTITASFAQSLQPAVSGIGVSTGGNTAGNTGTTLGQIVFAAVGNVTLNQSTAPGLLATISISVSQSTNPGAIAAGTQTATSGTVVFADSNGLTFGMSGSSQVTATADYVRSISAGTTNATGNQIVFSNSNNVSFGANGGTITAIAAQSIQPNTAALGVSNLGNTQGSTGTTQGTIVFVGAGIVTLAQSTALGSLATISISATASQSTSPSAIAAGTQTATSGTVLFADSNGLSFGMSGNSRVTASADYVRSISAGTTNATGNQIVFSNSNNVSFGANGQTITASIAQSTQPGVTAIGVSNIGNTAGNTGTTQGTIVFAAIGNITLSQSTAAGSVATISFSVNQSTSPSGIAAGTQTATSGTVFFANSNGLSFGMSNSSQITASYSQSTSPNAISAGTTQITSGTAIFSNSNGVSFGVNGQTITASVAAIPAGSITMFSQWAEFDTNYTVSAGVLSFQKVSLPMGVSGSYGLVLVDLSGHSNSFGGMTLNVAAYQLTGQTAQTIATGAGNFSWTSGTATSATSIYGGASGTRYRSFAWNVNMAPGDYLFAFVVSTTNDVTCRIFGRQGVNIVGTFAGAETSYFLDGISNAPVITFPSTLVATNTNYVRTGLSALQQPGFILVGTA